MHSHEKVRIEGFHAIKHALSFGAKIDQIFVLSKKDFMRLSNLFSPALSEEIESKLIEINEKEFMKLSTNLIRTEAIAFASKPKENVDLALQGNEIVYLDNPRDLNNVGAVIRVLAAAGVPTLVVSGSVDPWHTNVVRAAAGLNFAINILRIEDIHELAKKFNYDVWAYDDKGQNILELKEQVGSQKTIHAFGTEREGLSDEFLSKSARIVSLPMRAGVSSLNLATSVSAVLYSYKALAI